jgi:ATP-dependent RNA helicase DeaD
MSFETLGLSESTLAVLGRKGFETPTPIQARAIPAILEGDVDIIGQAQTGTGKTAAFGIPIIEDLSARSKTVQALVLTPTRELAIQVSKELDSLKGSKRLSMVPIYGGDSIGRQVQSLQRGVDIVVGTPGRILDHLGRGTLDLSAISFIVLDEADEMLNMGFIKDVEKILDSTGPHKRTLLFSATMPREILRIARKYMGDYHMVGVPKERPTTDLTRQVYYEVSETQRFEALCRIIDAHPDFYGLVFCRTKIDVHHMGGGLADRGYDADVLHGDLSQAQREKTLNRFKARRIKILVATDVAARGIDVHDLTHVINYALPQDPDSYIHRIGRTGRAGKEGTAVTLIRPSERGKLRYISKVTKAAIHKAQLPKVQDVIETKKAQIEKQIRAHMEGMTKSRIRDDYLAMSREILKAGAADEILAALLQYSFDDTLNENHYKEIEEVATGGRKKTRLFVAGGKKDGLTRKKLTGLIKDHCRIAKHGIKNMQIYDSFAFVTLPLFEAEALLSQAKRKRKWKGPFISKAKKPNGASGPFRSRHVH